MKPRAFVDTWGWVAWAVADDPAHARAEQVMRRLQTDGALLVSSNFVLAEALTRLRYDFGLADALFLLETAQLLEDSRAAELVTVDEPLWQASLSWFRRFTDQRFSMVDCTSFAIMQAQGISDALTADRHFAVAGFTPLGA